MQPLQLRTWDNAQLREQFFHALYALPAGADISPLSPLVPTVNRQTIVGGKSNDTAPEQVDHRQK